VNIHLPPELSAHRRGRFLASLLGIEAAPGDDLPPSGMLLMIGEAFQAGGELQTARLTWARQPGCALLLLPPYQAGPILPALDWVIDYASASPAASPTDTVVGIIGQEVMYRLQGRDGSEMTVQGGQGSLSNHTRYWKAHANSGLLAVTTLPLWSISLLNHALLVRAFLDDIGKHVGKRSSSVTRQAPAETQLEPHDMTVMVCCYAFNVVSAANLSERLDSYAVPLLNLAEFDLPASITRLRERGFIDDLTMTEAGLAYLSASKYWTFAENLKGGG
jgi:hypothetical protein